MRLGHVALSVKDIERSARFYGKYFGLKKRKLFRHPEAGLTIALLTGGFTLELFEFKKRKPLPKYRQSLDSDLRTLGVKHFSVETSRVEALYKGMKKAGVRFATELRTFDSGKRYYFVKDPDGILVEIMESRR